MPSHLFQYRTPQDAQFTSYGTNVPLITKLERITWLQLASHLIQYLRSRKRGVCRYLIRPQQTPIGLRLLKNCPECLQHIYVIWNGYFFLNIFEIALQKIPLCAFMVLVIHYEIDHFSFQVQGGRCNFCHQGKIIYDSFIDV